MHFSEALINAIRNRDLEAVNKYLATHQTASSSALPVTPNRRKNEGNQQQQTPQQSQSQSQEFQQQQQQQQQSTQQTSEQQYGIKLYLQQDQIITDMLTEKFEKLDKNGQSASPLHWASLVGDLELVNLLLEYPKLAGTTKYKSEHGDTVLHWAARGGNPEVVNVLVKRDADIFALNSIGISVPDMCGTDECKNIVEKIMQKKQKYLDFFENIAAEADAEKLKKKEKKKSRRIVVGLESEKTMKIGISGENLVSSSETMFLAHSFVPHSQLKLTRCHVCRSILSVTSSAVRCEGCGIVCHAKCTRELPNICVGNKEFVLGGGGAIMDPEELKMLKNPLKESASMDAENSGSDLNEDASLGSSSDGRTIKLSGSGDRLPMKSSGSATSLDNNLHMSCPNLHALDATRSQTPPDGVASDSLQIGAVSASAGSLQRHNTTASRFADGGDGSQSTSSSVSSGRPFTGSILGGAFQKIFQSQAPNPALSGSVSSTLSLNSTGSGTGSASSTGSNSNHGSRMNLQSDLTALAAGHESGSLSASNSSLASIPAPQASSVSTTNTSSASPGSKLFASLLRRPTAKDGHQSFHHHHQSHASMPNAISIAQPKGSSETEASKQPKTNATSSNNNSTATAPVPADSNTAGSSATQPQAASEDRARKGALFGLSNITAPPAPLSPAPNLTSSIDRLLVAAKNGDLAEIERMLEAGADVNGRDSYGKTALMTAAEHGKMDIMRYLLDHNAFPWIQTSLGRTALNYALDNQNFGCVALLESQSKKGAQADALAQSGISKKASMEYASSSAVAPASIAGNISGASVSASSANLSIATNAAGPSASVSLLAVGSSPASPSNHKLQGKASTLAEEAAVHAATAAAAAMEAMRAAAEISGSRDGAMRPSVLVKKMSSADIGRDNAKDESTANSRDDNVNNNNNMNGASVLSNVAASEAPQTPLPLAVQERNSAGRQSTTAATSFSSPPVPIASKPVVARSSTSGAAPLFSTTSSANPIDIPTGAQRSTIPLSSSPSYSLSSSASAHAFSSPNSSSPSSSLSSSSSSSSSSSTSTSFAAAAAPSTAEMESRISTAVQSIYRLVNVCRTSKSEDWEFKTLVLAVANTIVSLRMVVESLGITNHGIIVNSWLPQSSVQEILSAVQINSRGESRQFSQSTNMESLNSLEKVRLETADVIFRLLATLLTFVRKIDSVREMAPDEFQSSADDMYSRIIEIATLLAKELKKVVSLQASSGKF